MGDLISRQAAIDALIERDPNCGIDSAEAIKALPSAQPEQWWIPCGERLPDVDGEYLVTKKCFGWNYKEYYESDIARYEKRHGWYKADEVIAWMPLPEPHREEGDE